MSKHQQYLQTDYKIFTLDGLLSFKVGQKNRDLNKVLNANNATTWAYISAANPNGVVQRPMVNAERQDLMLEDLKGYEVVKALGIGISPWPSEPAWFVFGLSQQEALALSKKYSQIAFLHGNIWEAPKLLYTV